MPSEEVAKDVISGVGDSIPSEDDGAGAAVGVGATAGGS